MDKRKKKEYSDLVELSAIGIMFPLAIAIGYGWGWLMDGWFGTSPILTYLFTGFGIVAAFMNLFRMTSRAARRIDDSSD